MYLLTLKVLAKELSQQAHYSNIEEIPQKTIESIFSVSYKYDSGKYDSKKKNTFLSDAPDMPIWYVTRGDKNGPYLLLMTVEEERLNEYQKIVYDKIVDIWNQSK